MPEGEAVPIVKNPIISGSTAQDAAGRQISGVNVSGLGQKATRGTAVYNDGTDDAAATVSMDADNTFIVAAAGNAYQVATYLARIVVTATGTALATVYDNAGPAGSTAGKIIAVVAANAAAGVIINSQMPVKAGGISVVGGVGSPALTVAYTP